MTAAGVDAPRIFTDTFSGAAGAHRPGLAALLDYARPGDAVVVTAIDRLGRSVAEVTRTIADFSERRILLRAIREGPELPKLTPGAKYAPPAAGPAAVAGLAALRTGACRPERGERGRVVVCGGRAEPSALG